MSVCWWFKVRLVILSRYPLSSSRSRRQVPKTCKYKTRRYKSVIIIPNFNCSKNIFKSFSSSSIQNTKTNLLRICDSTSQSTSQPKKFTLLQLLHYTTVNSNLHYTFSPAQLWGVLMLLAVQCSCMALRRMHTVLGMEYTLSAMWHTICLIMASISSFWPKRHYKKNKIHIFSQ